MTYSPATVERTYHIDRSKEAIVQAITKVRETHEEINPKTAARNHQDWNNSDGDRRQSRRIQLQMPVTLTVVEESDDAGDVLEAIEPDQIAVTRDISAHGLGIVHDMPLTDELALVQFDMPGESPITLLFEVRWTVRKTQYSYVSGGRLMGVVVS